MKAALIADDLTGANNAGVIVARQSFATMSVSHARPAFPQGCEVVCIDTDSRYVDPAVARERVRSATAWAAAQGTQVFCNRVDNLLRGNIGAETEGILAQLGPQAAAIASPAFPALGRLIVDGHLMVGGKPVHENAVAANDPFAPVRHSAIAAILAQQTSLPTAVIPRDGADFDIPSLTTRIEAAIAAGARIVVVDQRSEDDVVTLACAMAEIDRPLVPVDPGPLSALYLTKLRKRRNRAASTGRILVAIGSVTPVTRAQFQYLLDKRGVTPVLIDPLALVRSEPVRGAAIAEAVAAVGRSLAAHPVTVLTTRPPDRDMLDVAGLAAERALPPHSLSKSISDGLAAAVVATVAANRHEITGCFASGGDLVASIFATAEAEAIEIFGDVIPLTAYVTLVGGRLDGLPLVTKGGSIGDETAIDLCVGFLEENRPRGGPAKRAERPSA